MNAQTTHIDVTTMLFVQTLLGVTLVNVQLDIMEMVFHALVNVVMYDYQLLLSMPYFIRIIFERE